MIIIIFTVVGQYSFMFRQVLVNIEIYMLFVFSFVGKQSCLTVECLTVPPWYKQQGPFCFRNLTKFAQKMTLFGTLSD